MELKETLSYGITLQKDHYAFAIVTKKADGEVVLIRKATPEDIDKYFNK